MYKPRYVSIYGTPSVQACLGAEESSYDNFAAFRTFESFPEVYIIIHVQTNVYFAKSLTVCVYIYTCIHVYMYRRI